MPKGRYAVHIRDAKGTTYQVSLFDPHEKVEIDHSLGGEFQGEGVKYHTGTYQVALRRQGARRHLIERIPLFGEDTTPDAEGVFTPWHKRVFVRKGKIGNSPDLLLITQYCCSNGDYLRAFFVQNGVLVPVAWQVSSKETEIGQYVNGGQPMEHLHGNVYQTHYYTNGGDEPGTHILTWRFEPRVRRMFLTRDYSPNAPPPAALALHTIKFLH